MSKISTLLKAGLASVALLTMGGVAHADELVATYQWQIQYANGISYSSSDATATITVEMYQAEGNNYYLKEAGTNIWPTSQIPFVLNGGQAEFKPEYAAQIDGKYAWIDMCYLYSGNTYMPQNTSGINTTRINYTTEGGFAFPANNGFGWYYSGSSTNYGITGDGKLAFIIKSQTYVEPSGGDNPSDPTYPALSELNGSHTFTANVEYVNQTDGLSSWLPTSGTLTITGGNKLTEFLNPDFDLSTNGTINLKYDSSTGVVNLQSNMLGGAFIGTGTRGVYFTFGYLPADATESFVEVSNNTTDILWYVTEDGHLTIPDFNIVDYTNSSNPQIIAKYTNVVVDNYIPDNSGSANLEGTYTWYLQQIDTKGGTKEAVAVEIEIVANDSSSSEFEAGYLIKEKDGTEYFLGYEIPFTFNDATNMITFENSQVLIRELDENTSIWFSPFVFNGTFPECMDNINFPWSEKDGFNFATQKGGLGFFTSTSTSDFIAQEAYQAYLILNEPAEGNGQFQPWGGEQTGSYPALSELEGTHTFKADVVFEAGYNTQDIVKYFPSTTTFTIGKDGSISGFIGSISSFETSYNQETGVLTPKTNNLGGVLDFDTYKYYDFGWANENGDWTGVVTPTNPNNGIAIPFTVDMEGHITLPNFTIVNYNATGQPIMIRYSNIIIDDFDPNATPEPSYPASVTEIFGEYPFSADIERLSTQTTYDDLYNALVTSCDFTIGEGDNENMARVAGFLNMTQMSNLQGTYNSETGELVFTKQTTCQIPISEYTNQTIYFGDAQGNFGIGNTAPFKWQLNPDGTFTIPDFTVGVYMSGIGYIAVAKYTNVRLEAAGHIPTQEEIIGSYSFAAENFELVDTSYSSYYKADFDFEITYDEENQSLYVQNFLYKGSQIGTSTVATNNSKATYDPETGIFTLSNWYLRTPAITGAMNGIAPEGEWGGIGAATGKKLSFTFNADGTVTIPDFDIITYNGNTLSTYIAHYRDINVTVISNGGTEGPGDEEIVAPESVEGIWTIETYNLVATGTADDPKQSTATYIATLDGNTVTFTEQGTGSAAGMEGTYHIIGKFTDPTTIEITQMAVGEGVYPLTQFPYTNGVNENSFNVTSTNDQSFTMTYDEEAGEITFSEGAGLKYTNVNQVTGQPLTDWMAALNLISISRSGDFAPELEISRLVPSSTGDNVTMTFDITASHWNDDIEVASWKANVAAQVGADDEGQNYNFEVEATVDLEEGTGSFTVSGLPEKSRVVFTSITISAYDADDELIAVSNSKQATAEVGVYYEISNFEYTKGADNKTLTVMFRANGHNTTIEDAASYIAEFRNDIDDEVYEMEADVVMSGNATIKFWQVTVVFDKLLPGQRDFYVTLKGYDEAGELYAESNTVNWDANVVGVGSEAIGQFIYFTEEASCSEGENQNVDVTVPAEEYNIPTGAEYTAVLSPVAPEDLTRNRAEAEVLRVPCTFENGVISFTIPNQSAGQHTYSLEVLAYVGDELVGDTYAPVLISFLVTGIDGINNDAEGVRYFNLQGVEVSRPENGVYIKVEGNRSTKVVK